jgi:hypothetical protein
MTKECTQNTEILSKYKEVFHILKTKYYQKYNYLSTSVDVTLLGDLWKDFINKNQGHENELSCFAALKMLHKDDFAFSIYKELHPDFITFEQALNNNTMDAFLDQEGLTDGSLAYLNALNYLGSLANLTSMHDEIDYV